MDKIDFQNGVTKVNADTFNTFQNNIEKSAVIVSKNEPTTNEEREIDNIVFDLYGLTEEERNEIIKES